MIKERLLSSFSARKLGVHHSSINSKDFASYGPRLILSPQAYSIGTVKGHGKLGFSAWR